LAGKQITEQLGAVGDNWYTMCGLRGGGGVAGAAGGETYHEQ